jgi:hypothetical protein
LGLRRGQYDAEFGRRKEKIVQMNIFFERVDGSYGTYGIYGSRKMKGLGNLDENFPCGGWRGRFGSRDGPLVLLWSGVEKPKPNLAHHVLGFISGT